MKIDWQRVCLNLRRYKSLEQVAKEVGADGEHLRRIARGDVEQPRFNTGMALLDLHLEKLPEMHKPEVICK